MSLIHGIVNLAHWWLEGWPPVKQEQAEHRAGKCAICPLNHPDDVFAPLRGTAAAAVTAAFRMKHSMKLRVRDEAALRTCDACGCPLKLKVWAPREVIFRKGEKPDYFEALDTKCWIKEEA